MVELSRREALASAAAAATLASTASPASALVQVAQASAAPASAAAWDLRDIYPTDAAWEADRQALLKAIPGIRTYQGKLGESAATLKAASQAVSDLNRQASRLYTHASLKADEDRRIAANQERKQQAQDVFTALGEATAWSGPEIVALGTDRVNALIAADPGLNKFAFGLRDILRQAKHTLSPAEEQLLASASAPLAGPNDIRDQLAASDIPRPTVKLSDGRDIRLDDQGYTLARGAPNRADRKMVFDQFWGSYKAFENSLGAALLQSAALPQLARSGARQQQRARGGLSLADRRDQPRPAGAASLFRASPADAGPARHGLLGHLPAVGEI